MDPYIGEIRLFAGTYVPAGWALCDGQILQVTGNQALFSIIGNTYGGNFPTTFGLPNLLGSVAVGAGAGPGLTLRQLAQSGGTQTVTLTESQIPPHQHPVACGEAATVNTPQGNVWGNAGRNAPKAYAPANDATMNITAMSAVGGNQPHNNMQPFVALRFIIALDGVYPIKP